MPRHKKVENITIKVTDIIISTAFSQRGDEFMEALVEHLQSAREKAAKTFAQRVFLTPSSSQEHTWTTLQSFHWLPIF